MHANGAKQLMSCIPVFDKMSLNSRNTKLINFFSTIVRLRYTFVGAISILKTYV